MRKTKSQPNAVVKITPADIALLRARGPTVIEYYRNFGLGEARSRALSLIMAGLLPIVGWLFFGWSSTAMVIFMLVDALFTILIDWLRLAMAAPWLRFSHARDHEAGEVLAIVSGLDDGSNTRSPRNNAPGPELIVAIGTATSVIMIPFAAAALEPLGLASVREVVADPLFIWFIAGDLLLRLLGALHSVWLARAQEPGKIMIFAESGGVAVLLISLLVLVWLPIKWGANGLLVLFAVLYLFRISFGLFALWWMPRAVRSLERRVMQGDYSVVG